MTNDKFYAKINWKKMEEKIPKVITDYLAKETVFFAKNVTGKVLDVGCGTGRTLRELSNQIEEGYGIDISSESIEYCKTNLPKYSFVVGNIQKTRFPNAYFDTIILSYSLIGQVKDIKQAINELKRILKKNGQILFTTYSEYARNVQETAYMTAGLQNVRSTKNYTSGQVNNATYRCRRFNQEQLKMIFNQFKIDLEKHEFTYFGKAVREN